MFIEKIKSEGLAHLSYVVGAGGQAAVIDPRRDCDIYVETATARSCRITHILETHRNEDLVSGAPVLAARTGAEVFHGPNAAGETAYARTAVEGDAFLLGTLLIKVLETPGHTDDSLSFALYDTGFGADAVGVFTGDALFVGDVGRTDFYPDRAAAVAGLLYDSLGRIMALGDQAIIYPAHGAGSVCGSNLADREFSTIGHERRHNPLLASDRETFIARKLDEHHYKPPYFKLMERLNREGAPSAGSAPLLLDLRKFEQATHGARLVDVRNVSAFLGAHLPGSLALGLVLLPAFAGWLLDPEQDIVLIADDREQAALAARHLTRIGYDRVLGYLDPSMPEWAAAGRAVATLPAVGVEEVARRVAERPDGWTLLDVRGVTEVAGGIVPGAQPIYVGELPRRLNELDPARHYTVMCASGARATVAASLLQEVGFRRLDVFLGSMGAWQQAGHALATPSK